MPQAPKPLDPNLSGKHRFGAELRAARVGSGMSQADLAKLVHVHPDLIAKVEKATRWPTESLATSCDSALCTGGRLAALWPDAARERQEGMRSGPNSAASDAEDVQVFEPIGEVAGRLWRLGDAATEAALSVVRTGIADIVERYETEDPAALARTPSHCVEILTRWWGQGLLRASGRCYSRSPGGQVGCLLIWPSIWAGSPTRTRTAPRRTRWQRRPGTAV